MNHFIEYVTGFSMVAGPIGASTPLPDVTMHTVIDATGLAAFQPGPEADATPSSVADWDLLDRIVQHSLSALTTRVIAQEPAIVWKAGRTSARAFPLFSYRVYYHLDGDDYDPIVVGVTVTTWSANVRVAGDISGDESGFVYFDEGCTVEAPPDHNSIQNAAQVVADRLAAQDSIVLDAIRNRRSRSISQ